MVINKFVIYYLARSFKILMYESFKPTRKFQWLFLINLKKKYLNDDDCTHQFYFPGNTFGYHGKFFRGIVSYRPASHQHQHGFLNLPSNPWLLRYFFRHRGVAPCSSYSSIHCNHSKQAFFVEVGRETDSIHSNFLRQTIHQLALEVPVVQEPLEVQGILDVRVVLEVLEYPWHHLDQHLQLHQLHLHDLLVLVLLADPVWKKIIPMLMYQLLIHWKVSNKLELT